MVAMTVVELAAHLQVDIDHVRAMVKEGRLLALKDASGRTAVPVEQLDGTEPVKHLPAVLTLLRDASYSADESWQWLNDADDSLPGTPLQALHENRASEVKRRAQALGF